MMNSMEKALEGVHIYTNAWRCLLWLRFSSKTQIMHRTTYWGWCTVGQGLNMAIGCIGIFLCSPLFVKILVAHLGWVWTQVCIMPCKNGNTLQAISLRVATYCKGIVSSMKERRECGRVATSFFFNPYVAFMVERFNSLLCIDELNEGFRCNSAHFSM